jgi:autoinducer 2-degrading protein
LRAAGQDRKIESFTGDRRRGSTTPTDVLGRTEGKGVTMYGTLLKLTTRPGQRDELITFLGWDADVAREREPGTLRFDVWKVPNDHSAVYLYEAYVDRNAFLRHQANDPYKKFVAEIEPKVEKLVLFEGGTSVVSNVH